MLHAHVHADLDCVCVCYRIAEVDIMIMLKQLQVIKLQLERVTLLYSDSPKWTQMAPQELCTLLNSFYSAFDEHQLAMIIDADLESSGS